ncbi:patatin-like phospholipase family protein [Streptosporangium sp. G11]
MTASCAVPGVWPPVAIGGRRYFDGGLPSPSNADLARGCDRMLILSPRPQGGAPPWGSLVGEIVELRPAEVLVVHADEASVAAFGQNPLSSATRRPSAETGRAVGRARAAGVAAFWAA